MFLRFQPILLSFLFLTFVSTGYPGTSGWYSVPVDGSLAPYATFSLNVETTGAVGSRRLSYTLPADLSGRPVNVELVEQGTKDGFRMFQGSIANAACLRSEGGGLSCMVSYHSLSWDRLRVQQYLMKKYGRTTQFQKRFAVALAFGAEPAGMVRVPAAKPAPAPAP